MAGVMRRQGAVKPVTPCQSHLMNSYCHAWSCTPAYFLRQLDKKGR